MNLEKEFTCSICTEILYRPLTLLDCLHTFCGGCLKQWFSFQKAAIERKMSEERRAPAILYTCPSCRAEVRNTKGNATVTTLLEMYLKMHPEKEKSEEEKKELDAAYKRGDSVLPPPPSLNAERSRVDTRERDIVRAMQGSTISGTSSSSRNSETRPDSARAGRLAAESTGADRDANALQYQSSLRSILSGTEFDSIATEEEVMQLVMQEGLLNGVDLHNLTPAQEDEIIGQIALAYRRKERARAREAEETRRRELLQGRQREPSQTRRRDADRPQSRQRDSSQTGRRDTAERRSRQNNISHPPVSRPHLLETGSDSSQSSLSASTNQTTGSDLTQSTRRRRHTSSERPDRPATRSATDLTLRPESNSRLAEHSETRRTTRRISRSTERRATDPHARSITEAWRSGEATSALNDSSSRTTRVSAVPDIHTPAVPVSRTRLRTSSIPAPAPQAVSAPPKLSCNGCGKQHIECEVHYNCKACTELASSAYNLCRACYRRGKGCAHWTGFGHNSAARQELRAERFVHGENGSVIHQQGNFCDTCAESANACYWSCDSCNDGEWGYCVKCVKQGRVCRHSLLPTTVIQTDIRTELRPLSITNISCDNCHRKGNSLGRYLHCPTCYMDLCEVCHHAVDRQEIASGRPGRAGWHRCPEGGHRMQFIETISLRRGVERKIYRDVEGGWAAKSPYDAHRLNGQPTVSEEVVIPHTLHQDIGRTMVAVWTRIPDDGVEDELSFPRGAEIREVKEVNEDWSYGVYCRMMGLFPSNHVRFHA
jgi:hypothetical protein